MASLSQACATHSGVPNGKDDHDHVSGAFLACCDQ
jgi:hypothetical protein